MRTRVLIPAAIVIAVLFGPTRRADAQAMLADDIVILSKGQSEQEKARTSTPSGGHSRHRRTSVPGHTLGAAKPGSANRPVVR